MPHKPPHSDRMPVREGEEPLSEYRRKRFGDRTTEPLGDEAASEGLGGLFVVQKHAARRTHYDLRLELDGVLKSWAVPKGPSLDPQEKRLAVMTEDHPLEYSAFEGVIPEGNYGAGAMIVWDRGSWRALEDPSSGLEKGKLLFDLHGYKLRGTWTLFRTKPAAIHRGKSKDEDRQWLLVKKPDAAARAEGTSPLPEGSILSGLTVEELAEGGRKVAEVRAELEQLGARQRSVDPRTLKLMLAQSSDRPFSRRGWLFELKYDGYRLIAAKLKGEPVLRYRNGHDATSLYPEICRALVALPLESVVLDGEVVVLDPTGRPVFNLLQKRALLTRSFDVERAAVQTPATLFAFDLLAFEGLDLRGLRLDERKRQLERLLPPAGPLRYLDHVAERGVELYREIERMGLEGMVAKRASSTYVGRRSSHWLKYRIERSGDFVVVGLSRSKGEREGFGSLHLAVWDEPEEGEESGEPPLLYAGRVGTGFSHQQLLDIAADLETLKRKTPSCRGELPRGERHVWVEPDRVCEVRYKEWTPQGMLRHPVFVRMRDDKPITDCLRPDAEPAAPPEPASPAGEKGVKDDKRLQLTNLDKVFWPEEGYTKGDLIDYYRTVAPWMLPYLEDRPVVLTRYPDGIDGKSFFQKHAPEFAPPWIRTEKIWSDGSERDIEYFVCNDEDSLVYLANLGTIPLHVWSSRLSSLDRPDWCILDLDPKEAPLEHVVEIARLLHRLCRKIELPSFVKTSGSTGLHVLVPLGASCSYEQSRTLGMLLAQIAAREKPEIATVVRSPQKREGKVYIDYVQNGHGRLLVAPLCLRPLKGAPVSTPLRWREVGPKLDLAKYNLETVPQRLVRQKKDPMLDVLEIRPDLVAALSRLSELL